MVPKWTPFGTASRRLPRVVSGVFQARLGLSSEVRCSKSNVKISTERMLSKTHLFAILAFLSRFQEPSWLISVRFWTPFGDPKICMFWINFGPNLGANTVPESAILAHPEGQDGPRWAKMGQDAPRWPNMLPEWSQDAPRCPQHAPNMLPKWPSMGQDSPKMFPREPQEAAQKHPRSNP